MPTTAAAARPLADLGVRTDIVDALAADGIINPFPIQAATLPDSLAGRDVLGRGKTGSGKTLAFGIPVVARLAGAVRTPDRPTGLILAPTRELATQIAATVTPLAEICGLRVTTIFGGVPANRQIRALKQGVDIVVACPGRLEDLLRQRALTLDGVRITALDEADHMADLGFLPAVTRILTATPPDGQRLLFSATLDNGVGKLVDRFLRTPVSHSVDEAAAPVPTMQHHVFEVDGADAKKELVHALAAGGGRRILFMRTKHHARRLAGQLTKSGIPAVDLHGNLSQPARDRNLAAFAAGTARVMVATDIAARGIHIDDLELVVHVDPPAEHKAYLHRSGRTARAGTTGTVVTLVLPEQRKDVAALLRKAGIDARPRPVTARSPIVTALTGTSAPTESAPAEDLSSTALQPTTTAKTEPEKIRRSRRSGGTGHARQTQPSANRSRSQGGTRVHSDGNDPSTTRGHRSNAAEHAGARGTSGLRGGSRGRTGHRTAGHENRQSTGTTRTTDHHGTGTAGSGKPRGRRRATRPEG